MAFGTVTVKHLCLSEYQDAKYGEGVRVANLKKPKDKFASREARCTVCGNTVQEASFVREKKEKKENKQ